MWAPAIRRLTGSCACQIKKLDLRPYSSAWAVTAPMPFHGNLPNLMSTPAASSRFSTCSPLREEQRKILMEEEAIDPSEELALRKQRLAMERQKFLEEYARDDQEGSSTTTPEQAVHDWSKSFYKRQETAPAHIRAVIDVLARQEPSTLVGPPSLPFAWLISFAFAKLDPTQSIEIFYDFAVQWNHDEIEDLDGKLDIILRAMYLANNSDIDAFLESHANECEATVHEFLKAHNIDPPPKEAKFEIAAALSLFPPNGKRYRAPVHQWALPALDLDQFQETVLKHEFPVFGCTKYHFEQVYRLREMHTENNPDFDRTVPIVASFFSGSILDSCWSSYFATGDPVFIQQLLRFSTCAVEFYEDITTKENIRRVLDTLQSFHQINPNVVFEHFPNKDPKVVLYATTGLASLHSLVVNCTNHADLWDVLDRIRNSLEEHEELSETEKHVIHTISFLEATKVVTQADK